MNSQQLLFINILLVAIAVFLFAWKRYNKPKSIRSKDDSVVKMTNTDDPIVKESENKPIYFPFKERNYDEILAKQSPVKPQRDVFFVYNGHEWSAYEVLNISDRSSGFETITAQYQVLIKTSDPSTFDFYEAAYQALLKARRS